MTRFAALALLGLVATIQLFVYPGSWSEHLMWASLLLLLVIRGPGVISLDHLVGRWAGAIRP
jgi:putative oxidoreductase